MEWVDGGGLEIQSPCFRIDRVFKVKRIRKYGRNISFDRLESSPCLAGKLIYLAITSALLVPLLDCSALMASYSSTLYNP
jgi:hypothetical protein